MAVAMLAYLGPHTRFWLLLVSAACQFITLQLALASARRRP